MKKFFLILVGILILTLPFLNSSSVLADDQIIAKCLESGTSAWVIDNGGVAVQTFVSTLNRISGASIYMMGNGSVSVKILDSNNLVLASAVKDLGGTTHQTQYDISFNPISATPGATYKLRVQRMSDGNNQGWYKSNNPNCYSNGSATVNGTIYASLSDFYFAILGYNDEPPAPTPAPTNSSNPSNPSNSSSNTNKNSNAINNQNTNASKIADALQSVTHPNKVSETSDSWWPFIIAGIFWLIVLGGLTLLIIFLNKKAKRDRLKKQEKK